MTRTASTRRLVAAAVDAVERAPTINDALAELGKVLRRSYRVTRVGVRRLSPAEGVARVVAVWSVSATRIAAGMTMNARATSIPEVVARDAPVLATEPPTLLDDVLRQEGARASVSVPLHSGWVVEAVLGVSSWTPGRIADKDLSFFKELGTATERRLLALVHEAPDAA